MGLLRDNHDDVPWLNIGKLVAFRVEDYLFAVWGAFWNFDVKNLGVLHKLVSFADFAPLRWFDGFAGAVTGFTRSTCLGVHSGAELSHGCFHTLA